MLATKWDGTVPVGGLIAQQKIDGIRALWLDGGLWSREGVPIEGAGHIVADLHALERRAGEPLFLDGEFQVDGTLAATMQHFRRAGRYGDAGELYLFDMLPLADWRADTCDLPLSARLERLERLVGAALGLHIHALPYGICGSPEALQAHAELVWALGGEGTVAKTTGSLYRRRRSAEWVKVKRPRAGHAGV